MNSLLKMRKTFCCKKTTTKLIVVIQCLLVMTLSGCSKEPLVRTERTEIIRNVVIPIPDDLTKACAMPVFYAGMKYKDIVDSLIFSIQSLKLCNFRINEIRRLYNDSRKPAIPLVEGR